MRKNVIIAICNDTNKDDWRCDFYYVIDGKRYFMFSENFTQGVYDFFRNGKSESELRQFKKWRSNDRLAKTITKIPNYVKYVNKYVA